MSQTSRSFARLGQSLLAGAVAVFTVAPVWADGSRVTHVEEHWELRLSQPDEELSAPQTTMVLSPNGNLDGVHFLVTLNHATVPDYQPGGVQVQAWEGSQLLDQNTSSASGPLSYSEEVVRWVQHVSLEDGSLHFCVTNGESETWGAFGGDDLEVDVPSALQSLNGYRPAVSLGESQVSYAENRVGSLILKKLVWITDEGDRHELNAPIAVDTSLDP